MPLDRLNIILMRSIYCSGFKCSRKMIRLKNTFSEIFICFKSDKFIYFKEASKTHFLAIFNIMLNSGFHKVSVPNIYQNLLGLIPSKSFAGTHNCLGNSFICFCLISGKQFIRLTICCTTFNCSD